MHTFFQIIDHDLLLSSRQILGGGYDNNTGKPENEYSKKHWLR